MPIKRMNLGRLPGGAWMNYRMDVSRQIEGGKKMGFMVRLGVDDLHYIARFQSFGQ